MKIALYTPYLDSFGGGERYILTVAEILSRNHDVDLLLDTHLAVIDSEKLLVELGQRFNLNLSKIKLIVAPIGIGSNFLQRLFFLKKYDLLFCLTDGSIFYSTAKKNILHFQVPFKNKLTKSLWSKFKLSGWNLAICNSVFTESYIIKNWPFKTTVLYPPVDVEKIKPLKKQKYILSVGRFASFSKSKKHEEMIIAFKELCNKKEANDWSLHLAGSTEGDKEYVEELRSLANATPTFFYPDVSFDDLVKLYGEASIYWHATGYGEEDPVRMEHFGITTVEAMAGGCVPIVINKGGQKEMIEPNKSGFLWDTPKELVNFTMKVINDPELRRQVSLSSIKRSSLFSKKQFENNLQQIIKEI